MSRLITTLCLLILLTGFAHALELGQVKVASYLNEPLNASFSIAHIDADSLGDIKVSLADAKSYQSQGLLRPSYLTKLRFAITAGQGDQHRVHITSQQRIREPILELLVKVTEKQSSVFRLYTLMLDPASSEIARLNDRNNVAEGSVSPAFSANQSVARVDLESDNSEGQASILVKNKSISLIAQDSDLNKDYSVYQIMRAFYLKNTAAFINANISKLQSGSRLIVPDIGTVAEVSRQKAINFVYSVSKDHPLANRSDAGKMDSADSNPALTTSREPDEMARVQPVAPGMPISRDIQHDLTTWRTMADEFKTLSTVMQTHNRAITVQNGAIKEMNAQLDAKSVDIAQLKLRLDGLEALRQSYDIKDVSDVQGVQNALANQNRLIELQNNSINAVNDLLTQHRGDISSINRRLDAMQQQIQLNVPAQQPEQPSAIASGSPELIAVQPADGIEPDTRLWSSPKYWFLLLMLIVLLMALTVIIKTVWKRRAKPLANTVSSDSSEISADNSVDDNSIYDASFKDEDISHAMEVEQRPVAKAAAVVHSTSNIDIKTIEDVHTEIDLLIAYEQFDDAQQLLDSARETHEDDHWLDVKELEILACSKNVDLFLSRFDQHKSMLSKEFPIAWRKILKMRDHLISEYKLKVVH